MRSRLANIMWEREGWVEIDKQSKEIAEKLRLVA